MKYPNTPRHPRQQYRMTELAKTWKEWYEKKNNYSFSHTILSKSLPALSSDIAGVDVLGCLDISSPRLLRLGLG